ncbi:hypothetical protein [Kitasatospora sp. NPDC015120]|uniref:hypothetical protein n=1 Tax=Kitasatospora sp. NPDC015120 TaxID=3364023 RepID=UPI0036F4618C
MLDTAPRMFAMLQVCGNGGEDSDGWVVAWGFVDKPYHRTPAWAVVGPKRSERPRIWRGVTPPDVLVDALHARAVAELERADEQTPWRWDEPAAGEIVVLADELVARGADVLMAVAQNRCRAVQAERGTKAEYFGRDQGDFVLVQGVGC